MKVNILKSVIAVVALMLGSQYAYSTENSTKQNSVKQALGDEVNNPLVTWRGLSIKADDFEAIIQVAPKKDQVEFRRDMRRITAMLENILVQRTLATEAIKSGLDKDPGVQSEFVIAKERILARKQLEYFEGKLKIPDLTVAAEEQYRLNPAKYNIDEMVNVEHILISKEGRTEEQARERAQDVLKRARAGEEFGLLARNYSEDPTAGTNAGNLGFFGRGKMVKPFEDAAFALENPGDLSEVVQTPFGYHIIRLVLKRKAKQLSFEEVKAQLIDELEKKWISDQKAAYIADIKNDKTIKLNEDGINALQIK